MSVDDASKLYTDIDSTNYATISCTASNNTTQYHAYIRGFNFSSIPTGSTINSFAIKIKGYEYRANTSTSYAPRLVNGTTAISGTTATASFGTSTKTITIPTGSLTWSDITGYSNFGVRVTIRKANSNNTGYLYIYGVEIAVDYTEPAPGPSYDVRVKQNGAWVQASAVYVKQNGTWSEATQVLAKSGGTWHG